MEMQIAVTIISAGVYLLVVGIMTIKKEMNKNKYDEQIEFRLLLQEREEENY